jgi:hypothetical protein
MGRRGVILLISSFKWFLPAFTAHKWSREGEAPCAFLAQIRLIMVEPGEQCTVVFALIDTGPANEGEEDVSAPRPSH